MQKFLAKRIRNKRAAQDDEEQLNPILSFENSPLADIDVSRIYENNLHAPGDFKVTYQAPCNVVACFTLTLKFVFVFIVTDTLRKK